MSGRRCGGGRRRRVRHTLPVCVATERTRHLCTYNYAHSYISIKWYVHISCTYVY